MHIRNSLAWPTFALLSFQTLTACSESSAGGADTVDNAEVDVHDGFTAPPDANDGPDVPDDPPDSTSPDTEPADVGGDDVSPDASTDTWSDVTAECGNGAREGMESCDEADLGSATCLSLGYADGGALGCTNLCAFDRGDCLGEWTCTADAGEPNEAWSTATPLAPGVYDRALCASDDDEDWYEIPTPEGTRDAVGILFDASLGRPTAEVWAKLEGYDVPMFYTNVLQGGAGLTDGPLIWAWDNRNPRPPEVYLRVYGTGGAPSQPYVLVYRDDVECFPGYGDMADPECAAGSFCSPVDASFSCTPGCESNVDCAPGQNCKAGTCIVPECTKHADCPTGEACNWEQECVSATCSGGSCSAFPGSLVCDGAAGYCVECVTAADCPYPADSLCQDATCVIDCSEDAYAPNTTMDTAAPITLTDGVFQANLALCGLFAKDVFQFTLDAAGPLLVTVENEPTSGEVLLGLIRKADGLQMTGILQNAGDRGALLFDLAADTYVLSLINGQDNWKPDLSVTYTLTVSAHAPECVASSACPAGKACEVFACIETECLHDQDCAPFGYACDEAAGYCAQCGAEADCRSLETCAANRCESICKDDAYEPNDEKAAAKPIAAGTHDLELCKARGGHQEDWFRVDLTAGQVLAAFIQPLIAVDDGSPTEWPTLVLLRADGSIIPPEGDGTAPLNYQAVGAETVFLHVHPNQAYPWAEPWGPLAYRLTVGIDPSCVGTPWVSDCPAGTICDQFTCLPGCAASEECSPGQICIAHQCAVPACHRHDECPSGEICFTTACGVGPDCDEDWDCTSSEYADSLGLRACDTTLGRCVECQYDGDCYGVAETCVAGKCVFECQEDAYEPNDDRAGATVLSLGTQTGLGLCVRPPHWTDPLNWPREEDWYAVDLSAGDVLRAEISPKNLAMSVQLANGLQVGTPTDWSEDSAGWVYTAQTTGRHWIRVAMQPQDTWTATPYELRLNLVECQVDAGCDPGAFCVNQECVATTCSTDASCVQGNTGTRCDLAHGYCVNCLEPDDCGPTGYLCTAGRCVVDCAEDAYEPNGASAVAAELALPFTASGLTLCGLWDEDWFRVPLASATHYLIELGVTGGGAPPMGMQLFSVGPGGELTPQGYALPAPGGAAIDVTTGAFPEIWFLQVVNSGLEPAPAYSLAIHTVP